MNKRRLPWLVFLVIGVVAVAYRAQKTRTSLDSGNKPQAPAFASRTSDLSPAPKEKLIEQVISSSKALAESANARSNSDIVNGLRERLSAVSAKESSEVVRQFLDSKKDAGTAAGFKIGTNGFLKEAPTLRSFLLDYFGQIDPPGAAAYAREILTSSDSPDEWAVALRNLARGDSSPESLKLLEEKAGELLRNQSWQQNASIGYLEAFDVAVFLSGTNLVQPLADLLRKQDNPAVAHAAFLAMDRLVINNTAELLGAFIADPALMQGREQTRANYFARADVRDPNQRQLLEDYLLNPGIASIEIQTFAGIYPNANFMISVNLLTQNSTPSRLELTRRDAESLRVLNEWLADARFANVRPQLEQIRARLNTFVNQAAK